MRTGKKTMELIDVVRKLVGPIDPVGETNEDARRYGHLQALTALLEGLLNDVSSVSLCSDRLEFSIKKAGEHAADFLESIGSSQSEE